MIKYALLLLALLPSGSRGFAQTDRRTYKLAEAENKKADKKVKETAASVKAVAEISYAVANMFFGGSASAILPPMRASVEQAIKQSDQLISNPAFDRLIKQDIAFAVVGSQSPTPGLSLDLSNQTSLKITGQIPSKRKIVTLDLTASRAEENVPLFADGKFNAQLSAGVNFHIIPIWNFSILKSLLSSSKRIIALQIGNTYSFRREDKQLLDELRSADTQQFEADLRDTIVVLGCYMRLKQMVSLRSIFDRDKELELQLADARSRKQRVKAERIEALERLINKKAFDSIIAGYPDKSVDDIMATVRTDNQKKLFFKLVTNYFPVEGEFDTFVTLRAAIEGVKQWKAEVLATDMERVCQRYVRRDVSRQDREIERSRPLWTRKQLNWFTVSAKPAVYSFNGFINDSTATPKAVRVGQLTFFELSAPLWYQFYDVRKAGSNFWRFGITPNLSSNRTDFQVANYTNSRTLITYPGQTVATATEQAGLYDDGTQRRNKFFINYYAEFYRLPRRNFIPGYSVRLSSIRNAVFGDDTDRKLRLELGGVLNILTAEKTKAIFTIQPYVAISSLNTEMITDGDNKRQKTLAEKTSAGIRVGIPIQNQLALGRK